MVLQLLSSSGESPNIEVQSRRIGPTEKPPGKKNHLHHSQLPPWLSSAILFARLECDQMKDRPSQPSVFLHLRIISHLIFTREWPYNMPLPLTVFRLFLSMEKNVITRKAIHQISRPFTSKRIECLKINVQIPDKQCPHLQMKIFCVVTFLVKRIYWKFLIYDRDLWIPSISI